MNPHRNRNSEAALPQAPDYTSQFVIWFNFESILWISMKHTESALWGAAAKPPRFLNFQQIFQSPFFLFRNPAESPKKWFFGDFFTFHQNFQNPFFRFRNPAESPKKWILSDFFNFKQNFQSSFFPFRNPTENLKRWFLSKFLQRWTFTRFLR